MQTVLHRIDSENCCERCRGWKRGRCEACDVLLGGAQARQTSTPTEFQREEFGPNSRAR